MKLYKILISINIWSHVKFKIYIENPWCSCFEFLSIYSSFVKKKKNCVLPVLSIILYFSMLYLVQLDSSSVEKNSILTKESDPEDIYPIYVHVKNKFSPIYESIKIIFYIFIFYCRQLCGIIKSTNLKFLIKR